MNPASVPDDEGLEELTSRAADEFMAQVEGGAAPDVEEFAGRHPEIAGVLRRLLPALRAMRESDGTAARRTTVFASAEPGRPGRLGDFEIVREVGRGGMGVVYEALQISLGRRVALKVLPFAAMLDPQRLQRFQNEARAAACLHHGNIVPVFAVGSDRGVHFYAMQYIEGRNLADLVHDMRRQAGLPVEENDEPLTAKGGRLIEPVAARGANGPPCAITQPAAALQKERLHSIVEETGRTLSRPPGKPGEHRPEGWKHSDDFWKMGQRPFDERPQRGTKGEMERADGRVVPG
ncbi:MAG TPA: hypothetical protein DDY78_14780 [Planctomycetales bacterium]|jgi:hypothetical protein|nr:hypothetical protein [Planctomycetales bacterium]